MSRANSVYKINDRLYARSEKLAIRQKIKQQKEEKRNSRKEINKKKKKKEQNKRER